MRIELSVPVTVLALLALAACGSEKSSGSDSASDGEGGTAVTTDLPLTGVRWSVDSLTAGGKKSAAPAGAHFEITEKGRAQGNYGCNQFGSTATIDGATVTLGPGEMTEIACAGPIQKFENTLRDALTGKLKATLADKKLTLTTAKGDSIGLTAAEPAPLIGTNWQVNSLLVGDVANAMPAGTEKNARLTLGKDGSVRGNLGCNTFTATAKVDGSKITFGSLTTSRMMCAGTAGQVEAHLRQVLKGQVEYKLQDQGLSLTGPGAKGVSAVAAP
ncbi:META domain-containing protein [Streptomyces sp. NPDC020965]|uniref:META domain-containing protein n=1 Tax=Streptomyces sp. NPDC020965 TaxID=3365105 RepID=UPI0037BA6578